MTEREGGGMEIFGLRSFLKKEIVMRNSARLASVLLTGITAAVWSMNPASAGDFPQGVCIANFTDITLTIVGDEKNSCATNDLKGSHTLSARHDTCYDVSGHKGDSCENSVALNYGDGKNAATFRLVMSSGNPAYIQEFGVSPNPRIAVSQDSEHSISVSPSSGRSMKK
jgi:hypothetical protein